MPGGMHDWSGSLAVDLLALTRVNEGWWLHTQSVLVGRQVVGISAHLFVSDFPAEKTQTILHF